MKIKDKNLYYIGGVVRDEILGLPSFDIDFCYEGDALDFTKKFNVIKTNKDFGTVKVLEDDVEIDIASTRSEVYPKAGHLPVVDKIGCSLEEDLKRRDFTINALAKNTVTGEIVDYFNGLNDIKNKKIKVLHKKSFIDDPSRIIRGLKFAVRFGFELEKETKQLQNEYLNNINYDMSYHRLKKELKEAFNLNNEKVMNLFIEQNIYKLLGENQVVPAIKTSIQELVSKYNPKNVWLVYLGLFNLQNFELNSEEQEIIDSFEKIKDLNLETDIDIYKAFNGVSLESILLYAIINDKSVSQRYLDFLQNIKIELTGEDLLQLGIPAGKIYSEIFNRLLEAKILNPDMTKQDELLFVQNYVK